jgi:hypothetical protein
MEPRSDRRQTINLGLELGLPPFELIEFRLQTGPPEAIGDRLDQTIEPTAGLLKFAAPRVEQEFRVTTLSVDFGVELLDEFGDELGIHEVVFERVDNQSLQNSAAISSLPPGS